MLQWRKWRDSSGDVVSMQLEASMETALIQVASHYLTVIETMKSKSSELDEKALEKKIRKKLEKDIRAELESEESSSSASKAKSSSKKASAGKKSTASTKKSAPKKAGGMFGAKTPKKTFEGKAADKADWFLADALDTIYDPHGTGKVLKPKTIVARSSEGNVRVQDVVRIYDADGKDGLSELAWTSPLTQYIVEAYDAC
jgi:hypothetical protein